MNSSITLPSTHRPCDDEQATEHFRGSSKGMTGHITRLLFKVGATVATKWQIRDHIMKEQQESSPLTPHFYRFPTLGILPLFSGLRLLRIPCYANHNEIVTQARMRKGRSLQCHCAFTSDLFCMD